MLKARAFRFFLFLLLAGFVHAADETDTPAPDAKPKREYGWNMTLDRIPKEMKVEDGIVYKTVAGQQLKLIVFYPTVKKFEHAPLLVYIHGGGFAHGNRFVVEASGGIDVVKALNDAGVVCVSIEYRLVDGKQTLLADSVADCFDAVRFMVKNAARFGIDPQRIATMGGSAGGYLSLMTALGQDTDFPGDPDLASYHGKVRVEVADFPLISLVDKSIFPGSNFDRPERLIPLLGGTVDQKHDLAVKLSPLSQLKPTSPPIFVAQGDNDKVLNPLNAITLAKACRADGVPVELIIVKGAGHGFSGTDISPSIAEISKRSAAFVLKYLLPPGNA
jgi:acetyl esterase/lipase